MFWKKLKKETPRDKVRVFLRSLTFKKFEEGKLGVNELDGMFLGLAINDSENFLKRRSIDMSRDLGISRNELIQMISEEANILRQELFK